MKTTLELPPNLFDRTRDFARQNRISFKAVVTQALLEFFRGGHRNILKFKLRDASVGGQGISPEFDQNWAAIRSAIYEKE